MSDAIFSLDAEIRTDMGKGASRRLRHEDKVPAILYGDGKEPVSITLAHNKLLQAQDFEAFYSHVLTINVEGKKVEALVKDMQRHPFKPKILHVDFLRVDMKKEVTTNVPLHFINEDKAKAIKIDGGHAEHHMNDVEVTCLPGDLPEYIEVDLLNVELDQTVHLSDIVMPKGVALGEFEKGEDSDLAVASIKTPRGPSAEELEEAEEAEEAKSADAEGDSKEDADKE